MAIFVQEVVIHLATEDLLGVDHHVAEPQALAHGAGVVHGFDRAAAALGCAGIAIAVVLHGEPDHGVARFRQRQRGHAGVDAAAHGEQDVTVAAGRIKQR
jgi:hypothetical protein